MNMRAVSVVVSCKIPILATRVRFPGDAHFFMSILLKMQVGLNIARVALFFLSLFQCTKYLTKVKINIGS